MNYFEFILPDPLAIQLGVCYNIGVLREIGMPASSLIGVVKMEKFIPVAVNKGKKFRGTAYDVGCEVRVSTFNIYGTGRNGWRSCESVKLWSPDKGWVYANPAYLEDREVSSEEVEADRAKYADFVLTSTVDWCRSRKPGASEKEVLTFARNVIRKHHAGMLALFDEKFNFKEDIAAVVESTLEWAFKLDYSNAKRVRIALRALTKKGLAENPAIIPMWTMWLDLRGLSRFVKKYLSEEMQAHCL